MNFGKNDSSRILDIFENIRSCNGRKPVCVVTLYLPIIITWKDPEGERGIGSWSVSLDLADSFHDAFCLSKATNFFYFGCVRDIKNHPKKFHSLSLTEKLEICSIIKQKFSNFFVIKDFFSIQSFNKWFSIGWLYRFYAGMFNNCQFTGLSFDKKKLLLKVLTLYKDAIISFFLNSKTSGTSSPSTLEVWIVDTALCFFPQYLRDWWDSRENIMGSKEGTLKIIYFQNHNFPNGLIEENWILLDILKGISGSDAIISHVYRNLENIAVYLKEYLGLNSFVDIGCLKINLRGRIIKFVTLPLGLEIQPILSAIKNVARSQTDDSGSIVNFAQVDNRSRIIFACICDFSLFDSCLVILSGFEEFLYLMESLREEVILQFHCILPSREDELEKKNNLKLSRMMIKRICQRFGPVVQSFEYNHKSILSLQLRAKIYFVTDVFLHTPYFEQLGFYPLEFIICQQQLDLNAGVFILSQGCSICEYFSTLNVVHSADTPTLAHAMLDARNLTKNMREGFVKVVSEGLGFVEPVDWICKVESVLLPLKEKYLG